MVAATEPRNTEIKESLDTLRIPMAAGATCYVGCLANVNANGYAVDASDSANHKCAGIVVNDPEQPGVTIYDNSAGEDGDMYVLVRQRGRARLKLALRTPSQDMLFAEVNVYDNQTVAVHKFDTTNDVRVGHIVHLPTETLAWDQDADIDADEVEIQLSGEPFEWTGDVTTTTAAPTTTTAAA